MKRDEEEERRRVFWAEEDRKRAHEWRRIL